MLRCLLVVTVALGLASAPLYAVAQAADGPAVAQPYHGHMIWVGQGSADHDHAAPAQPHAMGQSCCHLGCVMAVVPGFASLAPVPLPLVTIPIPGDPGVTPIAPLGPDRPPKRA
jgi:hypothetical protein